MWNNFTLEDDCTNEVLCDMCETGISAMNVESKTTRIMMVTVPLSHLRIGT
jgi:hypothetical protein